MNMYVLKLSITNECFKTLKTQSFKKVSVFFFTRYLAGGDRFSRRRVFLAGDQSRIIFILVCIVSQIITSLLSPPPPPTNFFFNFLLSVFSSLNLLFLFFQSDFKEMLLLT